jgi:hypothetical protein
MTEVKTTESWSLASLIWPHPGRAVGTKWFCLGFIFARNVDDSARSFAAVAALPD